MIHDWPFDKGPCDQFTTLCPSKKQCKDFRIGRKPKIRTNTQGKKQKMIVIEQFVVSNSTVLNQELNWGSTDWSKDAEIIKSLLSQPIKCND